MSEDEENEIEDLATKLHSIYVTDCKICSFTDLDWKAAKMILQSPKPQENRQ